MSYLDSGFDSNMEKLPQVSGSGELSSLDFDAILQDITANKLVGGTVSSVDKTMAMNLDAGVFTVNDGLIDRVQLGRIEGGQYGLVIRDSDGNEIFRITGDKNLIQSKTGKMQIDLDEEQARWYDETNLRILIGKAQGLFD